MFIMAEEEDKEIKKELNRMYKEMEQERQIRQLMHQLLEPSAYERLMNIKVSNNELYMQLVNMIVTLVQSNQIMGKVSERNLLALLSKINRRPETHIEFKHK
jgi:Double-stranded DNA-binding domain.